METHSQKKNFKLWLVKFRLESDTSKCQLARVPAIKPTLSIIKAEFGLFLSVYKRFQASDDIVTYILDRRNTL